MDLIDESQVASSVSFHNTQAQQTQNCSKTKPYRLGDRNSLSQGDAHRCRTRSV